MESTTDKSSNDIDQNATRPSESSTHSDVDVAHAVKFDDDENVASDLSYTKPRRRSSSGGRHEPKSYDVISDRKPAVEFVPPIEGTPAAEALAANKMIKVSKYAKGLHKIRGMKRPKMKNFNLMKKLNKTTKKKRKKKHFSKNFKGKVIDGVHELYTLTAGIMLGIRYTVGNAAYTATTVTVPDFTSVSNLAFPPSGNPDAPVPTPQHDLAHTFKFKSYSPKIFHRLREFFDISAAAYMDSVCGDYNFIEFISNSKSGQFFFYSHDGQYMLKTQTKEENKFMIRILPHYYQYLTENPHSLLVRILGMHRIKMYHLRRKVHFVVMTSVFDTPAQINTIYDLKGSLIGRSATAKERESGGVLKDNDLINDGCKLHMGAKKSAFMAQLEKDAMFLAKLNIMDYSLLVGIHDRKLRGRDTLVVPGGRDSSTSVPGGSAAAVNAAAATGAVVSTIPTDSAATSAGGVVGPSNGSVEDEIGAVAPPPPPVPHIHVTHSNTPFRRASALNSDLSTALADANALPSAHPTSSPPFTNRKKRTSTLKSDHTTSASADPTAVRLDMSRSMSLDEDYPPNKSNGHTAQHGIQTSSMDTPTGGGVGVLRRGSGSEVEEETEDEEEEEGDEGDEDEDGSDDESEFEDIDAGDSDEEGRTTGVTADNEASSSLQPVSHAPRVINTLVVEDGVGALGPEGFKLADILRADALKLEKNDRNSMNGRSSEDTPLPIYTYGPGQARRHPWTTRRDEGINSRTSDGKRGDEIYYLGVIDILQQYNANKRMETWVKGVTNDSTQISSVSPNKYARRFISFMNANID